MLCRGDERWEPTEGFFETFEVAELIHVPHATLNAWRVRYGLFGGSEGTSTARYSLSVIDACVGNLMAGLTAHGLPAATCAKIASKQQKTFAALLQNPDAPRILTFHRDNGGRIIAKVIREDATVGTTTMAAISTRVDLRKLMADVLNPYGIVVDDERQLA